MLQTTSKGAACGGISSFSTLGATQSPEFAEIQMIRVLLVDDHALFRAAIRALLKSVPEIEVVGEASNGREALDLIEAAPPNVVLMDILMPQLNGLDATAQISAAFPAVRVVVLSMNSAEQYVFEAMRAGAAGFLLKNAEPAELKAAVKAVANGETFLSPAISKYAVAGYLKRIGEHDPSTAATSVVAISRVRREKRHVTSGMIESDAKTNTGIH
jgi:DNA-binding NarL/FixJ family response regulator